MKPSLRYTYCTLLLVSLVSCCLLFILVASETLKPAVQQERPQQQQPDAGAFRKSRVDPHGSADEVASAAVDGDDHDRRGRSSGEKEKTKVVAVLGKKSGAGASDGTLDPPRKGSGATARKVSPTAKIPTVAIGRNSPKKSILTAETAAPLPEDAPELNDMIFLETISKNVGVTNSGLQDIPGTPSVITLVDHHHGELSIESKLEENIEATLKNISRPVVTATTNDEQGERHEQQVKAQVVEQIATEGIAEQPVVDTVGSQFPPQAIEDEEELAWGESDEPASTGETVSETSDSGTQSNADAESDNKPIDVNLTEENPIPVFSEWAQKQMAEAEKKLGEAVNASSMKKNAKPASGKLPAMKIRAKNYAAPDCGAKIIAANPEAQSTESVLTAHKDEYLLNPCTRKNWFVVELCEPVQAERIELANFELFSSSPKDFTVSVSNRFPTRDWANVGQFTAKDERDVQSFDLHPQLFGKFIRVEILSHYNQEHYCPVSLFRVYGTSEIEAFETDNTPTQPEDDDDDDEGEGVVSPDRVPTGDEHHTLDNPDAKRTGKGQQQNILKSAGEAVMSIVKKAAEALGKSNDPSNDTLLRPVESNELDINTIGSECRSSLCCRCCFTLSYPVRCVNCTNDFRTRLESTMNCKHNLLTSLLSLDLIRNSFEKSQHFECANILGFSLPNAWPPKPADTDADTINYRRLSVLNLLPSEFIAGFCNIEAFRMKLLDRYAKVQEERSHQLNGREQQPGGAQQGETVTEDYGAPVQEQPALLVIPSTVNPGEELKSGVAQTEPKKYDDDSHEEVNIFNVQDVPEMDNAESSKPVEEVAPVAELPSSAEKEEAGNWETLDNMLLVPAPVDGLNSDPLAGNVESIPAVTVSTTTTPAPGSTQKVQPESVFLRLSNRIKSLERNMTLSGQYLEELSRRYRKQVEELQHSYAKTLHEFEELNRRIRDSETMLREENEHLRREFLEFRESVFDWRNIGAIVAVVMFVQLLALFVMLRNANRRKEASPAPLSQCAIDRELALVGSGMPIRGRMLRRKSIDGMVIGQSTSSPSRLRKKRPSEEALNISGTYMNLLIDDREPRIEHKKHKSKQKHRKISAPAMGQTIVRVMAVEPPTAAAITDRKRLVMRPELMRAESAPEPAITIGRRPTPDELLKEELENRIDELPLLEDNDEFIIPTASDLSYNEFVPDGSMSELGATLDGSTPLKANGTTATVVTPATGRISSSSSIDSKKSSKIRRLSSPAFFKSSLLRSSIGRKTADGELRRSSKKSNTSNSSSSSGSHTSKSNVTNSNSILNNTGEVGNGGSDPDSNPAAVVTERNGGWDWYRMKQKSSSQEKVSKRSKSKSASPPAEDKPSSNGTVVEPPSSPTEEDTAVTVGHSASFNGSADSSGSVSDRKSTGRGSIRRLLRKMF